MSDITLIGKARGIVFDKKTGEVRELTPKQGGDNENPPR